MHVYVEGERSLYLLIWQCAQCDEATIMGSSSSLLPAGLYLPVGQHCIFLLSLPVTTQSPSELEQMPKLG